MLYLILVLFECACLFLLLRLEDHPALDELLLHVFDQLLKRTLLLSFDLKQLLLALKLVLDPLLILIQRLLLPSELF